MSSTAVKIAFLSKLRKINVCIKRALSCSKRYYVFCNYFNNNVRCPWYVGLLSKRQLTTLVISSSLTLFSIARCQDARIYNGEQSINALCILILLFTQSSCS